MESVFHIFQRTNLTVPSFLVSVRKPSSEVLLTRISDFSSLTTVSDSQFSVSLLLSLVELRHEESLRTKLDVFLRWPVGVSKLFGSWESSANKRKPQIAVETTSDTQDPGHICFVERFHLIADFRSPIKN
jgi:hypothetical protein